MQCAIVLGAAGFIGNAVDRYLIQQGASVLAVSKPGTRETEEGIRLKDFDAEIVECDLRSIYNIGRRGYKADLFYNCAWEGTDAVNIADYRIQQNNIKWSLDAIEVAASLGCHRYIQVGSISQLELQSVDSRFCVSERHRYYRAAQDCCENMGRALAHERGIEFVWPILINIYGEDAVSQRFINKFVHNVLHNVEMPLSSGEQLYDFLHLEDAAAALYKVGFMNIQPEPCIVGSGETRRLRDYLIEARDILNPAYPLQFGAPDPNAAAIPSDYMDTKRFCDVYGFNPSIDFRTGILRLKEWEMSHHEN